MLDKMKFLLVFLTFFSFPLLAELAPDELVRKTADDVITAIKSDKDIQAGNKSKIYKLAEEKILPNFDFDKISRLVIGKHWRTSSEEQKLQFKEEFKNLLLRTYAVALGKYQDQKIEFLPMRMKPEDKIVTVKSEIIQSAAQPVKVDYVLTRGGPQGWSVIDIIIEGVSLVTNYRGQFASEIKSNGMDGLIKALAAKNKSNDEG
ncbi:MAG: ABC transporter substrate-binding protein [Methylophilaceae bacterium]|nr:ABC transporter substrate-binding protein [Methylophilaceae bacterium]MBL6728528.1 ABC transporter substrate-binding protein [Methylophilaceae bacterium]